MGDVTALADSLGLSDSALAAQLSAGRSLAQIAASRGVPTSTPTATGSGATQITWPRCQTDGPKVVGSIPTGGIGRDSQIGWFLLTG